MLSICVCLHDPHTAGARRGSIMEIVQKRDNILRAQKNRYIEKVARGIIFWCSAGKNSRRAGIDISRILRAEQIWSAAPEKIVLTQTASRNRYIENSARGTDLERRAGKNSFDTNGANISKTGAESGNSEIFIENGFFLSARRKKIPRARKNSARARKGF